MTYPIGSPSMPNAPRLQAPTQGPDVLSSVRANFAEIKEKNLAELLASRAALGLQLKSALDTVELQSANLVQQQSTNAEASQGFQTQQAALGQAKRTIATTLLAQNSEKAFLAQELAKEAQIGQFLKENPQALVPVGTLAAKRLEAVRQLLAIQSTANTFTTLSYGLEPESPMAQNAKTQKAKLNDLFNQTEAKRADLEKQLVAQMRSVDSQGVTLNAQGPMPFMLKLQEAQINNVSRYLDLELMSQQAQEGQKVLNGLGADPGLDAQTQQARQDLAEASKANIDRFAYQQTNALKDLRLNKQIQSFVQAHATDSRIQGLLAFNAQRVAAQEEIAPLKHVTNTLTTMLGNADPQSEAAQSLQQRIEALSKMMEGPLNRQKQSLNQMNQLAQDIDPNAPVFGVPISLDIESAVEGLYSLLSTLAPKSAAALAIQERIETLKAADPSNR